MLKVLFLKKKRFLGSSRIRVLNLLPELAKYEIEGTALPWPTQLGKKFALLSRLSSYDVVVLQKKLLHPIEFFLLRKFSKKLVYDFDDAVFIKNDRASDHVCRARRSRFVRTVANVDMVIAGNHFLAEEVIPYNERVTILSSAVEASGIPVKKWGVESRHHVIGWVGYGHNLHHLSVIGTVLQRLAQEYPIELRVVSNQKFSLEGVRVVNIPWTLGGQAAEIAGFDIGVMPLPKNSYTEGKCSYKALQYMAAAVPVVATNWGYNCHVINDGETGFLADDNDQFYAKMRSLIESLGLAETIGKQGRALIEREYSVEVVGAKMAMLLRQLVFS
jgi:glycosyltransferase involved in cell wall biosynthesis